MTTTKIASDLADAGMNAEASIVAPAIENLFETCIRSTWPGGEILTFAWLDNPQPGKIAKKLCEQGIYA